MHKWKVGDKVRVKKGWCDGMRASDNLLFVEDMERWVGKVITIKSLRNMDNRYMIEHDPYTWHDDFLEPIDLTFCDNNVVILKNGQVRLVHDSALYLPDGTCVETENYTGRKHNFDENFDIVEVRSQATGNYLFELSGELVEEV